MLFACPFLLWYGQNFCVRTTTYEIASSKLSESVTLVQLSDLHGLDFGRDNEKLVRMVDDAQPDLICVTGDMHTRGDLQGRRVAEALIRRLCALAPVFFVPGEHDRDSTYLKALADSGALIPDAAGIPCDVGRTHLRICGCSAAWFPPNCDLSERYRPQDDSPFQILLCHIPRPEAFAGAGIDLMLSGDSHGGLMRLPLLGCLYADGQLLPDLLQPDSAHWTHGAYELGDMTLWVNAGLGGIPARLFNRPEISVIRLVPDS